MTGTIRTGPLPRPYARWTAFRTLEVGQYLALPCTGAERQRLRNAANARRAYYQRVLPGRRFTVRGLEDGSGIGVWRIQ